MRWIGEGTELYSVRVDLVAPDDDHRWVSTAADALVQRLPFDSGGPSTLVGVDQGLGHEGLPVVGLTFLLRASGFGDAARLAVATATVAGADAGIAGHVYDVVLVPEDTLVLPVSERTIPMPD